MKPRVIWQRHNGQTVTLDQITNAYLLNIIGVMQRAKRFNADVSLNFPPYKVLVREAERRQLLKCIGKK